MVLCFMCARALVEMISGRDGDGKLGEWFPEVFKVNEQRLGKKFVGRLHTKLVESKAL
jgi:hypothetical protein